MQTLNKILVTVMVILVCSIAINEATAQTPTEPQPVSKGNETITDLGAGLPYPGLTEAEQVKLAQLSAQETITPIQDQPVAPPLDKVNDVVTDLGAGIPYQGLSAQESEKLQQWQLFLTQPGNQEINLPAEALPDESASPTHSGSNTTEQK